MEGKRTLPEEPVVEAPIESTPNVATSTPIVPTEPKPSSPVVTTSGTLTLKYDETGRVGAISITPLEIVEDSRCPINAMCVWQGTVRVSVRLSSSAGVTTETLTINTPFQVASQSVTLTAVTPYPNTTAKYSKDTYRFTFEVGKKVGTTPVGKCYVGGCSGQICSENPDAVSTCEYRSEYACYQKATCERQASGQCGWTMTSELKACLANPDA